MTTFDHAIIVRIDAQGREHRVRVDVADACGQWVYTQSGAAPEILGDNLDLAEAIRDATAPAQP